jgi:hypothetical protein
LGKVKKDEYSKIIVNDGIGQQVNPHDKYIDGGYFNVDWRDFNGKVQLFPVINPQGDGEFEARLKWCKKVGNDLIIINNNRYKDDIIQQAYQIVYKSKKIAKTCFDIEELAEMYQATHCDSDGTKNAFIAGYNACLKEIKKHVQL